MLKDVMKRSGFGDKKLLRIVAKTIGGVDRKTFNELVEDLWHNTMDKDRIGQGEIIGVDRNQNRYTHCALGFAVKLFTLRVKLLFTLFQSY